MQGRNRTKQKKTLKVMFKIFILVENSFKHSYEGELKSKGKIHLTALMEVTVSNFTYHFST